MKPRPILLAWRLATGVHAESLSGRVVGVSDGETLKVLVDREQVKIRINGIDAPDCRLRLTAVQYIQ